MLATGAVANWLAGVVAQQTTEAQISETAVTAYGHFFAQMGGWTLGCVAVMLLMIGVRKLLGDPALRIAPSED
ncbi:putative dipeptide and tripeptide permease YjdL [compost metagenome]